MMALFFATVASLVATVQLSPLPPVDLTLWAFPFVVLLLKSGQQLLLSVLYMRNMVC
jgi:hypothetical protein